MEKIKRLSPWEIFDLWETDAGKMDFKIINEFEVIPHG